MEGRSVRRKSFSNPGDVAVLDIWLGALGLTDMKQVFDRNVLFKAMFGFCT